MNDLIKVIYKDLFEYKKINLSYDNNFSYGGNLDLSCCRSLAHLPDKLLVDGDLIICRTLKSIPSTLKVMGDLCITGGSVNILPGGLFCWW